MNMKSLRAPFAFLTLIVFMIGITLPNPVHADDDTPEALLNSIYDQYRDTSEKAPGAFLGSDAAIQNYFEPSLATLIINDIANAKKAGEVPRLDGDPFVDAQDWKISALSIDVRHEGDDRASATARFRNYGKKTEVHYFLVRTQNGWRISNIVWKGNDKTLRGLYTTR